MKKVTAAIIEEDGKILIAQRGAWDKLALKWEFPGGKIETGETPEECLVREIKEELDLDIEIIGHFATSIYTYENGAIELIAMRARISSGVMKLLVHNAVEWVRRDDLRNFEFCPADVEIVEKIINNK